MEEDLKQTAEESQRINILIELSLDGKFKWVGHSWKEVIGIEPEKIIGLPISSFLVGNENIFSYATNVLLKDDSHIFRIHFSIVANLPPDKDADAFVISNYENLYPRAASDASQGGFSGVIEMEGHGILIRDRFTLNATHVCCILFKSPDFLSICLDNVDSTARYRN